jgi:hypothetical protein
MKMLAKFLYISITSISSAMVDVVEQLLVFCTNTSQHLSEFLDFCPTYMDVKLSLDSRFQHGAMIRL